MQIPHPEKRVRDDSGWRWLRKGLIGSLVAGLFQDFYAGAGADSGGAGSTIFWKSS